ncbi:MAG: helix-turn-helix transcriptional regulator [Clostridia bacterium]|nr:helix-turn-helix transcriptional regulator [Clostridia bacterium]
MELNLGTAIRRLRTERGMTQEELADYAGVSFQAVSKWETGTTTPDIALLPKLAVFFGVRIDDLFGITDEDELERVDYLLEHERITDENFSYSKKVLDRAL